jgi:pyridoxamine-phosphate oxidase
MQSTTLTGNPLLVDAGFDGPPENPIELLQRWLDAADRLNIVEPRGLALSTVDASGKPSSRIVLLKSVDETGIVFGSSEISQKGRDIEGNPTVAGTLWWRETMQQVNFCGRATKLPADVSDDLFKQRIVQAQAAAALSTQSAPMTDEKALREAVVQLAQQPKPIHLPETWHAYHITVESIEFWQGSQDRLHNRLRYDLTNGKWTYRKLQP